MRENYNCCYEDMINLDENVIKLIGELKGVVLNLHRSAGGLDNVIQSIENEIENISEEYLKFFIKAQANYRRDYTNVLGSIEEREKLIWRKLIEAIEIES